MCRQAIVCSLFTIVCFSSQTGSQSLAQEQPKMEGPRYLAYDHNCVIHLIDRKRELKPTDKRDAHPHIPEHYTFCLHPALSADADYVAFSSLRPLLQAGMHSLDIYVWERKSGKVLTLPGANTFAHDDYPSISADGNVIAFHTLDESALKTAGIRVYDRKAQKLLDLPNLNFDTNTGMPSLCPDGRFLIFSARTAKGDRDIYLYDREAKKLLELPNLNSSADEWSARVSKGARWIAFCSRRDKAGAETFLYDREAGKLTDLPNFSLKASALECDLSGDGRFLACVVNRAELRVYDCKAGKPAAFGSLPHQGRIQFSPAFSRE